MTTRLPRAAQSIYDVRLSEAQRSALVREAGREIENRATPAARNNYRRKVLKAARARIAALKAEAKAKVKRRDASWAKLQESLSRAQYQERLRAMDARSKVRQVEAKAAVLKEDARRRAKPMQAGRREAGERSKQIAHEWLPLMRKLRKQEKTFEEIAAAVSAEMQKRGDELKLELEDGGVTAKDEPHVRTKIARLCRGISRKTVSKMLQ